MDVTIANPSINGILGGLTGLAGILTTVWCGLRGWRKDEQRAVPTGWRCHIRHEWAVARCERPRSSDTIWFFVIGLPVLFVETWGLKLYRHSDEAGFRRIVLILLLLSGTALFVPAIAPSFAQAVMSRHPPSKPSEVR